MTTLSEILAANRSYASGFRNEQANLSSRPARKLAVLTCMDTRITPNKMLGTAQGDAHFIRNAGGRASDDAIRSLIISSKLLGTDTFLVIHHTDCGMAKTTDAALREMFAESDAAAEMEWLTIGNAEEALLADVKRIREHPLVPANIPIFGLAYDVRTGLLHELEAATRSGAPR